MEMPKKMVENVSEPSAKICDIENKANGGGSMEIALEGRDAVKVTSYPIDGDTAERGGAIVETPPNGGNGDGSHEAKETITGSFTELLLAPLGDVYDHLVETSQNVQEVVATEAEVESEPDDVSDNESDDTSDEGNTWYIHESDIDDMTSEDVESDDGDDEHVPAQDVVGSGNVASGSAAEDDEHVTEHVMVESEKAADVGVTADGEHVTKQVMVGSGNVTRGGVAADDEHVSQQVMVESEKVTDVGVAADDEHVVVGSAIVGGGSYASDNGVGVVAGEDGQPPAKKMRLENGGNGSASGYGNGLGNGNGGIARANVISTVSGTSGNGVQIRMLEFQQIRLFGVDMHQYVEVDPESVGQRGFRILSIDGGANRGVGSTSNGGVVGSRVVGSGVGGGSASGAGGGSRGGLPPVPRPNNARFP